MALLQFLLAVKGHTNLSEINDDTIRNRFLEALFGPEGIQQFSHLCLHDNDVSEVLTGLVQTYSWDIIDHVFENCDKNNENCRADDFHVVVPLVGKQVRTKEWEILVFDKAYSCNHLSSFCLLLHCFQLLLIGESTSPSLRRKVRDTVIQTMKHLSVEDRDQEHVFNAAGSFLFGVASKFQQWTSQWDTPDYFALKLEETIWLVDMFVQFMHISNANLSPSLVCRLAQLLGALFGGDLAVLLSLMMRSRVAVSSDSLLSESCVEEFGHVLLSFHDKSFTRQGAWLEVQQKQKENSNDSDAGSDESVSNKQISSDIMWTALAPILATSLLQSDPSIWPQAYSPNLLRHARVQCLVVLGLGHDGEGGGISSYGRWTYMIDMVTSLYAPSGCMNLTIPLPAVHAARHEIQHVSVDLMHCSLGYLDGLAAARSPMEQRKGYVAFRWWLSACRADSRCEWMLELIQRCPHSHIRVLLVDCAKDFLQRAWSSSNSSSTGIQLRLDGSEPIDDVKAMSLRQLVDTLSSADTDSAADAIVRAILKPDTASSTGVWSMAELDSHYSPSNNQHHLRRWKPQSGCGEHEAELEWFSGVWLTASLVLGIPDEGTNASLLQSHSVRSVAEKWWTFSSDELQDRAGELQSIVRLVHCFALRLQSLPGMMSASTASALSSLLDDVLHVLCWSLNRVQQLRVESLPAQLLETGLEDAVNALSIALVHSLRSVL